MKNLPRKKVLFWIGAHSRQQLVGDEDFQHLNTVADVVEKEVSPDLTVEDIIEASRDANIAISPWGGAEYTLEVFESCPALELIAVFGGTLNGKLQFGLMDKGVRVTTSVDAQGELLADLTVSLMLAGLHRLGLYSRAQIGGGDLYAFHSDLNTSIGQRTLLEKKVSLLGFGAIARYVVRMLKPFRCQVTALDPFVNEKEMGSLGVRRAETLEELCSDCDVFSIHSAFNDKTKGIVNRKVLNHLKDGALLVNTSYGELIDQKALEERLSQGTLFACLDMLDGGMPGCMGNLRYYPTCMITPTISTYSDGLLVMGRQLVGEIIQFIETGTLQYEVTKDSLSYRA